MAEELVSFIVIEVAAERLVGLGQMQFRVAPRQGDHITKNGDDGIAQNYEVVAVIHPSEPAETSGDLVVRYTGTDADFQRSLTDQFFVM